jgi:hypothetical protein
MLPSDCCDALAAGRGDASAAAGWGHRAARFALLLVGWLGLAGDERGWLSASLAAAAGAAACST